MNFMVSLAVVTIIHVAKSSYFYYGIQGSAAQIVWKEQTRHIEKKKQVFLSESHEQSLITQRVW